MPPAAILAAMERSGAEPAQLLRLHSSHICDIRPFVM